MKNPMIRLFTALTALLLAPFGCLFAESPYLTVGVGFGDFMLSNPAVIKDFNFAIDAGIKQPVIEQQLYVSVDYEYRMFMPSEEEADKWNKKWYGSVHLIGAGLGLFVYKNTYGYGFIEAGGMYSYWNVSEKIGDYTLQDLQASQGLFPYAGVKWIYQDCYFDIKYIHGPAAGMPSMYTVSAGVIWSPFLDKRRDKSTFSLTEGERKCTEGRQLYEAAMLNYRAGDFEAALEGLNKAWAVFSVIGEKLDRDSYYGSQNFKAMIDNFIEKVRDVLDKVREKTIALEKARELCASPGARMQADEMLVKLKKAGKLNLSLTRSEMAGNLDALMPEYKRVMDACWDDIRSSRLEELNTLISRYRSFSCISRDVVESTASKLRSEFNKGISSREIAPYLILFNEKNTEISKLENNRDGKLKQIMAFESYLYTNGPKISSEKLATYAEIIRELRIEVEINCSDIVIYPIVSELYTMLDKDIKYGRILGVINVVAPILLDFLTKKAASKLLEKLYKYLFK